MFPPTTLFEDAVDVPIWLEADGRVPLAERRRRDREIARRIGGRDAVARVRLWWQHVDRGANAGPGTQLQHARRWVAVAAALIGLVSGTGLAAAAFRYDGTYPVNVVRLLGVLIAPQLVLLALTALLLPGRVPVLRPLQDALAAINPGALVAAGFRHFARSRDAAVEMFGWASARSSAARRFAKWQMLYWSQIAAVALNVGIIATASALIAFTDLAFGWSTTLALEPDTATHVVTVIAKPWTALVPSAVPDAALVAQSQFFRLEGAGGFETGSSQVLAGWWSFTLMSVIVYGLVPRLAFLAFAGWRLGAATRRLLLDDTRVTALLDRMAVPDIETRARHDAIAGGAADAALAPAPAHLRGRANAVIWSGCIEPGAAGDFAHSHLGLELGAVVEAGGAHSLEAERAALDSISDGTPTVVVFTPAWEPPVLAFLDFLALARKAVGASVSIVVTPVGEDLVPVTELERQTWIRAIAESADPRVYFETGGP